MYRIFKNSLIAQIKSIQQCTRDRSGISQTQQKWLG